MFSTFCDVSEGVSGSIVKFLETVVNTVGPDIIFFIALAVEALLVIFFLVKSLFSYEAQLNRALEKLNYWLFDRKVITENNIKEVNMLFKTKTPKRMCYHWQQYILFREGTPSSYLSVDNLIEKPLKTSSYNSNIKNLTLFTTLWALVVTVFTLVSGGLGQLTSTSIIKAVLMIVFILLIGIVFVVYLRARKNAILNSLYQNCSLFGRFMDNACVDLPSYIDYQILFTPQEIENGQPVLREFLDYKARKEKEEFAKAREEEFVHENYDFSVAGVNGSVVLERAMRECETFLKKKEKLLLKISQLEGELDTRRKNFDSVQKDYQTKIQASKENVERLRQMQEETTNRIESNYYRKQQTQEIAKQEQFEQEFEQQRARYLLEKNEGEAEIAKLNEQMESDRSDVEYAMLSEYQTFFNNFCESAEKVVTKAFGDRINELKTESEKDKEYITQLEIKLKNKPDGEAGEQGTYDKDGNYVFENGTFYDADGNFHDQQGNVYSQDGKLISAAPAKEEKKQVVNFDDFDDFDFMTDVSQKGDVYNVAEKIVDDLNDNIEVVNSTQPSNFPKEYREKKPAKAEAKAEKKVEKAEPVEAKVETKPEEPEQPAENEKPEVVAAVTPEVKKPAGKRGRPRKIVAAQPAKAAGQRGRPKKVVAQPAQQQPKRAVGRPRKIVKTETAPKRGRGRPRKTPIQEINQKLSDEEKRIEQLRTSIDRDLQKAMRNLDAKNTDDKASRREQLIKQIEDLQKEAQNVLAEGGTESRVADINARLENLLAEIKKLNS